MPGVRDLAVGLVLAALAVGLLAHLVTAYDEAASPYHVVARAGLVALTAGAAGAFLLPRPGTAGRVALAGAVVMVLAWPIGLLADPSAFVGAGPKSPETAGDARLLGAVLAGALALLGGWLGRRWRRWRSGAGEGGEHG